MSAVSNGSAPGKSSPSGRTPRRRSTLHPAATVLLVVGVTSGLLALGLLRDGGLILLVPLVIAGGCGACLIVFAPWTQHPTLIKLVGAFAAIVIALAAILAIPGLTAGSSPGAPRGQASAVTPAATPTVSVPSAERQRTDTPSSAGPSPSKPSAALIVKEVGWPMFTDCDGARSTVALEGQPGPDKYLRKQRDPELRKKMIADGGAAWQLGIVTLVLTAPKGEDIVVTGISPAIFSKKSQQGTWRYQPLGGCGGSDNRAYAVQLDATDPHLFEVDTTSGEKKSNRFGPAFHVSSDDQVTIEIWASDCDALIEWGLAVTYSVGGDDDVRVAHVRNSKDPYRSIGGAKIRTYADAEDFGSVVRSPSLDHRSCQRDWP